MSFYRKFEYHIHETEFRREFPELLSLYFDSQGKSSWELINIITLQTIDNRNVMMPGQVNIKISFLCIFKRKKSWIRKFLSRLTR